MYGISKSTLYKAVKEKRISYIRVGNSIRTSKNAVSQYVTEKSDSGKESVMSSLSILTAVGSICKFTNTQGTTYYQLRKFPLRYIDRNGTIEYAKSKCFKKKRRLRILSTTIDHRTR